MEEKTAALTQYHSSTILTATAVVNILMDCTDKVVEIVTSDGIDPIFFEKYTMLLNSNTINYIRDRSGYCCESISFSVISRVKAATVRLVRVVA